MSCNSLCWIAALFLMMTFRHRRLYVGELNFNLPEDGYGIKINVRFTFFYVVDVKAVYGSGKQ